LCRARVGATAATRYFAFYANIIESLNGYTITALEDEFGSWRQAES